MTDARIQELHNAMIELHEPCLVIAAQIMQLVHSAGIPRETCMTEATKAAAHYLQASMMATKQGVSAEEYQAMKEHIINKLMSEEKLI